MPLVLHGSSGVPDQDLAAAVRAGMTKVNIATQLNKVYTAAVRHRLVNDPAVDRSEAVRFGGARAPSLARKLAGRPGCGVHRRAGTGEPLSPVE